MPLKYEKPSDALLSELKEVSSDARRLVKTILNENRPLPSDFPRSQLISYAEALSVLVNGTAEGCREPLVFTRNELTRIRRENILNSDQADKIESDLGYDAIPPIRRGDNLDRSLRTLISSVSTALDEYRVQASEIPENDLIIEASTQTPDDADIDSAKEQSEELEIQLNNVLEPISLVSKKQNESEDKFVRVLKDTHTQNKLVRTVMFGPKIVKRWVSGLIVELQRKPQVIKQTHDLMRLGAFATLPLGLLNIQLLAIAGTLSTLAGTLTVIERRYLAPENNNDIDVSHNTEQNAEPPSNEKAAVREAKRLLGLGKPVPVEIAHKVKVLNLYNIKFQDTKLLSNFKWLQELHVHWKRVTDWSGLKNLQHLQVLNAENSSIKELSFLRHLKKLTKLELGYTDVNSLDGIRVLTQLKVLKLNNSSIQNFSGLSDLANLSLLDLRNSNVTDSVCRELKGLNNLTHLYLNRTAVGDEIASYLGDLKNLQFLDLENTLITDAIGVHLEKLVKLRSLDLRGTEVTDEIGHHLGKLTKLGRLMLSDTNVSEKTVSHLKNITRLRYLSLANTNVSDKIGPELENLTGLFSLDLSGTSVSEEILSYVHSAKIRRTFLKNTNVKSESSTNLVYPNPYRVWT